MGRRPKNGTIINEENNLDNMQIVKDITKKHPKLKGKEDEILSLINKETETEKEITEYIVTKTDIINPITGKNVYIDKNGDLINNDMSYYGFKSGEKVYVFDKDVVNKDTNKILKRAKKFLSNTKKFLSNTK